MDFTRQKASVRVFRRIRALSYYDIQNIESVFTWEGRLISNWPELSSWRAGQVEPAGHPTRRPQQSARSETKLKLSNFNRTPSYSYLYELATRKDYRTNWPQSRTCGYRLTNCTTGDIPQDALRQQRGRGSGTNTTSHAVSNISTLPFDSKEATKMATGPPLLQRRHTPRNLVPSRFAHCLRGTSLLRGSNS